LQDVFPLPDRLVLQRSFQLVSFGMSLIYTML
jgi:hypothetical protein